MKRAAVILGLVTLVTVLPASAWAQQTAGQGRGKPGGQSTGSGQPVKPENQQEIKRLREELKTLQQQLREHEQLLKAARKDQDKSIAKHEEQVIKRLQADIKRVQGRINELQHGGKL